MTNTYRAFRIAYDGRGYRGFQRQPDQSTVEGVLLEAFGELGADPEEYVAASRTDAGVSAAAQTVAIGCPVWLGSEALNGRLPADVRAWLHADVSEDFHPRYDAAGREYGYIHYAPDIDLDRVRQGCERLVGCHEFRHLTADAGDTRRTLRTAEVRRDDPFLRFRFEAPSFLRHQVRRVVTLLDEFGRGERSLEEVDAILAGEPLTGERGISPADPRSLVLEDIRYEDAPFEGGSRDGSPVATAFKEMALVEEREASALRSVGRRVR